MKIAVCTFDGFNEIDSFVAAYILNRVHSDGWKAEITAPSQTVTSMNGVVMSAQKPLEFVSEADAVIIGSGRLTQQVARDESIMSRIRVDPERQLIASQCSGALILAGLGLVEGMPICTDLKTRPMIEADGVRVLDTPFHAEGNIASAGGCLAGQYLATWIIWRSLGREAAVDALSYVVPVGQQDEYISRALETVSPFISVSREEKAAAFQYR